MTELEKFDVLKKKTIGQWTEMGIGYVEVKQIEYGIEDYLICTSMNFTPDPKVHRLKIRTTRGGRPYVVLYGRSLYLDECLRTD